MDKSSNNSVKALPIWLFSLAAGVVALAVFAALAYARVSHLSAEYRGAFWMNGTLRAVIGLCVVAVLAAVGFAAAGVVSRTHKPWSLVAVRFSFWLGYFFLAFYIYLTVRVINVILDGQLVVGDGTLENHSAFWLKIRYNLPAIGGLLWVMAVHGLTWLRSVRKAYHDVPIAAPLFGISRSAALDDAGGVPPIDRVRISGKHNPAFGGTMWASFITHVLIILVVPWMLTTRGCSLEEFHMPGGGGGGSGPKAQPVAVKVAKKKPVRKKKYIFRPNSAISFHTPTLDDSKVVAEVEQVTENQYQSSRNIDGNGGTGGFGSGPGKGGGWPGGGPGDPIPFVQLQYEGAKWNDGLNDGTHATENFLVELHKASNLPVEPAGKAYDINRLKNMKKGRQVPFVFMTGDAGIEMPEGDVKALHKYLLDGGMLFADCGSGTWHNSFVSFTRRLFPEQRLVDIPNDDPIFNAWFPFPNGAPPLWHHGGSRALGIKVDGRWAVFYFPGDMKDAWKSGHTGSDELAWQQSYKLGINVVKYAFDHYSALNQPKKK